MSYKVIKRERNTRRPFTCRMWDTSGNQTEKSFRTREEARDHGARFQLGQTPSIAADRTLFGDAAERWIDDHHGTRGTRDKYRSVLHNHMAEFTARSVAAVAADKQGVKHAVVDHSQGKYMLIILRGVCDDLDVAHGFGTIKRRARPVVTRDFIEATDAQLKELAQSMGRDGIAVQIMRQTGMRIAELLGLTPQDIGPDSVNIARQCQDNDMVALKHKQGDDSRQVPVTPEFAAEIRAWVSDHWVGPTERMFPVSYDLISDRFRAGVAAAGLPEEFTPHQLRHAFASIALANMVPLTDVARWMGHADTRTTSQVYGHLVRGGADRLRAAFG